MVNIDRELEKLKERLTKQTTPKGKITTLYDFIVHGDDPQYEIDENLLKVINEVIERGEKNTSE